MIKFGMINDLKEYFQNRLYAFVLLFGSYAKGVPHEMSDVDISVKCGSDVDLLQIGYDTAMLEEKLGKRVQIVPLDGIYKKESFLLSRFFPTIFRFMSKIRSDMTTSNVKLSSIISIIFPLSNRTEKR